MLRRKSDSRDTRFQCQQILVSYSKWMQWIKRRGRRQLREERESREKKKESVAFLVLPGSLRFCLNTVVCSLWVCVSPCLSPASCLFLREAGVRVTLRERETKAPSFPLMFDLRIDVRNSATGCLRIGKSIFRSRYNDPCDRRHFWYETFSCERSLDLVEVANKIILTKYCYDQVNITQCM